MEANRKEKKATPKQQREPEQQKRLEGNTRTTKRED